MVFLLLVAFLKSGEKLILGFSDQIIVDLSKISKAFQNPVWAEQEIERMKEIKKLAKLK